MDSIDVQIVSALQQNGRLTVAELAERVGLTEAPVWRRVRKLEEEGWITGYHASVDRSKVGLKVVAIVTVRFATHNLELAERFVEAIQDHPNVLNAYNVTGDVDYILTVLTKDLEEYEKFTLFLRGFQGIVAIQTHLSLREVKQQGGNVPSLDSLSG